MHAHSLRFHKTTLSRILSTILTESIHNEENRVIGKFLDPYENRASARSVCHEAVSYEVLLYVLMSNKILGCPTAYFKTFTVLTALISASGDYSGC